jgi:hypothetical protein
MAKELETIMLFGLISVVVSEEQSKLVSVDRKQGEGEVGVYHQLCYRPKGANKDAVLNIFKDSPYYHCAQYSMVEDIKKSAAKYEEANGFEMAEAYEAKLLKADALKERKCFNVAFDCPKGWRYVLTEKNGDIKKAKNYELAVDGDLSSLKEIESEVVMTTFDYWVAEMPTAKSIASYLVSVGKFEKA